VLAAHPPDDPGLIQLTIAETNRLHNLFTRAWHTIVHHLHWSHWRRRHQARPLVPPTRPTPTRNQRAMIKS
jgi:hypothetical protein